MDPHENPDQPKRIIQGAKPKQSSKEKSKKEKKANKQTSKTAGKKVKSTWIPQFCAVFTAISSLIFPWEFGKHDG